MMVQAVKNLPQQQQLLICAATKLLGGGGQDQSAASAANQAAKSGLSALPRKVWLKGKAGLAVLPQKELLEGKPCAWWNEKADFSQHSVLDLLLADRTPKTCSSTEALETVMVRGQVQS